ASAARADIQTIRDSDNEYWGAVGTSFFNYKEPSSSPNLPDSERGWLPSLALGVSTLGADDKIGGGLLGGNLYFALEGAGSFGDADYRGSYIATPTVPLQGTTSESIWDVNAKIGKGYVVGDNALLIPYVELGYHYWNRDLGAGQVEDYQHFAVLGGAMLQYALGDRFVLSGYGAAGSTLSPKMTTSSTTYDLQDQAIYKIGGKIGYSLTKRTELFSTLDYNAFSYGHSDVIGGLYEPDSHTENTTIRIGLGFHFR
ncbi:MAG: hypothetical protein P4M15_04545, partial [Alphaproteobacteria bacterium]|nr:hypothetical protein [Alphaproteobacteria bacterium]